LFGVIFPIGSCEVLSSLDARELGYRRVNVPLEFIRVAPDLGSCSARGRALALKRSLEEGTAINIWTYVPNPDHVHAPDEKYPIIQTYVDVCARGCLEWGGRSLAIEFIESTSGWSSFYLNDAPMSRRPWLHRIGYSAIDSCLEQTSATCLLHCRRHPEEYAAEHLSAIRGMWGVPPRNGDFIGRSRVLDRIHEIISGSASAADAAREDAPSGVELSSEYNPISGSFARQVEIVGIGGVGKTQTAVEYVHRAFRDSFLGLVVWLRASSTESLSADLRRFAFDVGAMDSLEFSSDDENDRDAGADREYDDELVADEIKRRLLTCRCSWLIVLDNVESLDVISYFSRFVSSVESPSEEFSGLQRSPAAEGHLLVTTRSSLPGWEARGSAVSLNCFEPDESVEFIKRALHWSSSSMRAAATTSGGGLLVETGSGPSTDAGVGSAVGGASADLLFSGGFSRPLCSPRRAGSSTPPRRPRPPSSSSSQRQLKGRGDERLEAAYRLLADRMCHLPLALSMAVAYMRRCDVDVAEYVQRLDALLGKDHFASSGAAGGVAAVNHSVVASLRVSVERITAESTRAAQLLPCLGFLYPDNIIKPVISSLIRCIRVDTRELPSVLSKARAHGHFASGFLTDAALRAEFYRDLRSRIGPAGSATMLLLIAICTRIRSFSRGATLAALALVALVLLRACASAAAEYALHALAHFYDRMGLIPGSAATRVLAVKAQGGLTMSRLVQSPSLSKVADLIHLPRKSSRAPQVPLDESAAAESDLMWEQLVQFSIMSVRSARSARRVGSIHRLQQSVLKSLCDKSQSARCLEHCICACDSLWSFNAHNPDFQTWDNCAELLTHIDTIAKNVCKLVGIDQVPSRLAVIEKAHRIQELIAQRCFLDSGDSAVRSQDLSSVQLVSSVASELLETLYALHVDKSGPRPPAAPFSSSGVRLRYMITLSNLLVQAGAYSSVVQSKFDSAELFLDYANSINGFLLSALAAQCGDSRYVWTRVPLTEVRAVLALTSSALYNLGKALRYIGSFDRSKSILQAALDLRQRDSTSSSAVSDVLHELGVLALKSHRLDEAELMLNRSLKMKRQHSPQGSSSSAAAGGVPSHESDTTEASTLHQLGVVARAQGRFDDAEDLLRQSLAIAESAPGCESSSTLSSRAATIQQLGRIALRRGSLAEARELFLEALGIYEKVYGDRNAASHVNTAAVHHQIGVTAMAERNFADACAHFTAALCSLDAIYADCADPWRKYDIVSIDCCHSLSSLSLSVLWLLDSCLCVA
jgi:tetratricopeptide (TPR) repeat protein